MADSLKDLKYVKNYNYQISTSANSNSISAVETASDNSNNQPEQASNQCQHHNEVFRFFYQ